MSNPDNSTTSLNSNSMRISPPLDYVGGKMSLSPSSSSSQYHTTAVSIATDTDTMEDFSFVFHPVDYDIVEDEVEEVNDDQVVEDQAADDVHDDDSSNDSYDILSLYNPTVRDPKSIETQIIRSNTRLDDTNIEDFVNRLVVSCVEHSSDAVSLNLNHHNMEQRGDAELAHLFDNNDVKITELHLRGNPLYYDHTICTDDHDVDDNAINDRDNAYHYYYNSDNKTQYKLLESLRCNSISLRILDLSETGLGDDGMNVVAQTFFYNTTITTLIVEQCNISSNGIIELAKTLRTNTVLQVLNLSSNYIGSEDDHADEDADTNTTTTNIGLLELCTTLRSYNTTLRVLNLFNNILYDQDVYMICDHIVQYNTTLLSLDINGNEFDNDTAGQYMLQTVHDWNDTLVHLPLNTNTSNCTAELCTQISTMIHQNRNNHDASTPGRRFAPKKLQLKLRAMYNAFHTVWLCNHDHHDDTTPAATTPITTTRKHAAEAIAEVSNDDDDDENTNESTMTRKRRRLN